MSHKRAIGIWVRVSTEDQARGESPEHHRKRAEAYAEAKGWKVAEYYDLSGVSGKSVMEHKECKRMLSDIRSGQINTLVFSKLARLARNTRELLDLADIFEAEGADMVSLSESIDTSTPAGRLFFTMIAAMAQWEREEIRDRVRASVPIRAKLGKHLSGVAPYGYRWDNHEIHIVEGEATVRRLIFTLFIEHKRLKTVARILTERGFRTRKGKAFSDTTIRRLLTDPIAKGLRRSNYTTAINGTKQADRYKPEEEWEWHPCPAIVSEELWDKCNDILKERKRTGAKPAKRTKRLFSGILECHCGNRMYVRTKSKKYSCTKCLNKIPMSDIEGVFVEQLKAFFFSEEELSAYMSRFDAQFESQQNQLDVLEKDRSALGFEMDKLFDLHKAGQIPTEDFGKRYEPLAERVSAIDEEMPRLQAQMDVQRIAHQSRDQIVHDARSLYSQWDKLSHEQKREIIDAIVEKIIIGEGDIDIRLHYIPENPSNPFESPLSPALPLPKATAKGQPIHTGSSRQSTGSVPDTSRGDLHAPQQLHPFRSVGAARPAPGH